MSNKPTNEERAARIDYALDAYRTKMSGHGTPPDKSDLRDMLADIMHYCNREGIDFDAELSIATDNYFEEC